MLLQAFDFETGLPKRCVRMESWPIMDKLSRPFWDHLGRAALESFVPTETTEGFLVMFDRYLFHDSPSVSCCCRLRGHVHYSGLNSCIGGHVYSTLYAPAKHQ